MSLQVYLPLNGNLNQLGNSGLTFSPVSSNTTIDNIGKYDKSYNNNSHTAGGLISNTTINLGQNQSMFCWFKFDSLYAPSDLGASMISQHRYAVNNEKGSGMGITIKYVTSTTGYLSVNTSTNNGRTYNTYCSTTLLKAGEWYHGGYTYNGSVLKIYLNGVCEKTVSISGMNIVADYLMCFCWSFNSTSGTDIWPHYKLNGNLNEVRVYDHALSDKEVVNLLRVPPSGGLNEWLPLIGNLHNNCHIDTSIVNSGAVVSNTGKIGKSYNLDGVNDRIDGTYVATKNISFCMWVYFKTTPTGWHVLDARQERYSGDGSGIGYQPMYVTNSSIQIGNTGSTFEYINYPFNAGQWYHICVTHDKNGGYLYVNGEYIGMSAVCAGNDLGLIKYTIGSRYSGAYYANIKVNDLRIYNKTLSAKEVNEVARGLVAYYKLDNNGFGTSNLLTNSNNLNSWDNSGGSATLQPTGFYKVIYNTSSTTTWWGARKVVNLNANTTYTASVLCYGTKARIAVYQSGNGAIEKQGNFVITEKINDTYPVVPQLSYVTFTAPATRDYYIICAAGKDEENYYLNPKLEEGDKPTLWCPHVNDNLAPSLGINGAKQIDNSGYNYELTKTGTPTFSANTPKNTASTYFNGSTAFTTASGSFKWFDFNDKLTVAAWMKPTITPSSSDPWIGSIGISHNETSSSTYYSRTFAISNYNGKFTTNLTNGSSWYNVVSDYTMPLNTWHHYAATLEGPLSSVTLHCDNNIYTEPDGTRWIRVAHHNNPANGALFSQSDSFSTYVYKDENRWYEVEPICGIMPTYEFMVKQKSTSDATEIKYRWKQNTNPLTASWDNVEASDVTRVTTSGYTDGGMGGLFRMNTYCRMVIANATNGNWFGAFGSWNSWSGGIPGYPNTGITTGYMDLYVRIDNWNIVKMYVDGVLKKTEIITWGEAPIGNDTKIQIGIDLPGGDEFYTGYYSDARFYVTALKASDILELCK